ncbi:hypothetical protein N7463_001717 [Penicillium fimorum]|uniref:Uncharacterized protein n=1 Tax=Penicillium fimorum TaxID=1882269 RepID=A0A9X0C8A8_9EURO|nr:hypothetical protein N7463_001717 [Penicillium fimorum]
MKGRFIISPAGYRLSDTLRFLIICHKIVPGRERYVKWPFDFNSDGDIYPEKWLMGHVAKA